MELFSVLTMKYDTPWATLKPQIRNPPIFHFMISLLNGKKLKKKKKQ